MKAADMTLQDAASLLKRGWTWWIGEMKDLVPPRLLAALRQRREILAVEIGASDIVVRKSVGTLSSEIARFRHAEIAAGAPRAKLKGIDSGAGAVLRVPPGTVLVKRMALPFARTSDLRRMLNLEIERQSPLAPDQIDYRTRILKRDKRNNRIEAECLVIERGAIARFAKLCHALGLVAEAIEPMEGRGAEAPWRFPLHHPLPLGALLRRHSLGALAIVVVAIGAAALLAQYERDAAFARQLEGEIKAARIDAHAALDLPGADARSSGNLALIASGRRSFAMSRALLDITHTLPDGTWLYSLTIKDAKAQISGYSPDASGLIKRFDGAPSFSDAEFEAPLLQGPSSGLQSFDLSFKVKGSGP